jgi:hypothetical protein
MGISQKIMLKKSVCIRLAIIALALSVCEWSEMVVGKRIHPNSLVDYMHEFFTPVNAMLHANPHLANVTLAAITLVVDIAGISLIMLAIFGKSIRPFIGICLLYGLRQTVEMMTNLPAPEGMIWRDPGFPSLLVDYHVMTDFFFSGHTAIIVYALAELSILRRGLLTALGIACALIVIAGLFSLRAHYTMDVYAGLVTPLLAFLVASSIAKVLDPMIEGAPKDTMREGD